MGIPASGSGSPCAASNRPPGPRVAGPVNGSQTGWPSLRFPRRWRLTAYMLASARRRASSTLTRAGSTVTAPTLAPGCGAPAPHRQLQHALLEQAALEGLHRCLDRAGPRNGPHAHGDKLVAAAEAGQHVAAAQGPTQLPRHGGEQPIPASWPWVSLMALKPSRSIKAMRRVPGPIRQENSRVSSSIRARRLGKPVWGIGQAWRDSSSLARCNCCSSCSQAPPARR